MKRDEQNIYREVVESLRDDVILVRIEDHKRTIRLKEGIRAAFKAGMPLGDISNAAGVPVDVLEVWIDSDRPLDPVDAELAMAR